MNGLNDLVKNRRIHVHLSKLVLDILILEETQLKNTDHPVFNKTQFRLTFPPEHSQSASMAVWMSGMSRSGVLITLK